MRLSSIVILNLVGRLGTVLLGLISLPVNLYLLGIEAVGLVGFYTTLYGLAGMFEHVLAAVVMREGARIGQEHSVDLSKRDFLRTFELVYCAVGVTLIVALSLAAPFY